MRTHRDEETPTEVAHEHPILVAALRVDRDYSGARPAPGASCCNNCALAVERVTVENGGKVPQRFGSERGDRLTRGVGHRDPEKKRVDECPDNQISPKVHLRARVVSVGVHRTDGAREQAEEVILGLGNRVAGPMAIDIADLEIIEVAAEAILPCVELPCHYAERGERYRTRPIYYPGSCTVKTVIQGSCRAWSPAARSDSRARCDQG
jgi:hypothetical protein